MNAKERVMRALNYQHPDRMPLGRIWAHPADIFNEIFPSLGVYNLEEFEDKYRIDFRGVQADYIGPPRKVNENEWGVITQRSYYSEKGFYAEPLVRPFANVETVAEAEKIPLQTPDDYDYSNIAEQCEKYQDYAIRIGGASTMDFLNGIGEMRGVEQTYMDVATEDEVFLYLVEKRFAFAFEFFRRALEAAKGGIDIVYVGEDLGTQIGQIISPASFKKLFAEKYKAVFDLAHSYGAKTMMHSCGSIVPFIPILIDLGLDILEGVQVDAVGMDIKELHRQFYKKIAFHGSMSVQKILNSSNPQTIIDAVRLRQELFAEGGMFLAPANGLQLDMPPENLKLMYDCVLN